MHGARTTSPQYTPTSPSPDTETWAPLANSSMHNTVFPFTNEPCRGSQNVSSAAGGRWSALQHALAAKEAAETERCNTKRIISSFRWHVSWTLMKHNRRIFKQLPFLRKMDVVWKKKEASSFTRALHNCCLKETVQNRVRVEFQCNAP